MTRFEVQAIRMAMNSLGYRNCTVTVKLNSHRRCLIRARAEVIGIYDLDKRTFVD